MFIIKKVVMWCQVRLSCLAVQMNTLHSPSGPNKDLSNPLAHDLETPKQR